FQLQSTRPTTGFPFQEGEQIRVKYTEDGVLYYCWDGKVDKISVQENRAVTLSLSGVGVTVHKRKSPRVNVSIPFSFVIFEAAETEIISDQLVESTTRDMSVSGLSFTSDLPLKVGDQLQLNIKIPAQSVNAMGWVVRCEPSESLVSVEFLQSGEEEQRELMKFLADQQPE
ncbi:PilZ domain-containing protein, partial [Acidobacteria bacterium AH-259-D05]|nr:PilZ domain-containing protein [Acidobacteria bacterium AH-259-D05]